MTLFELLSALTTLAALFAWVNHRYFRWPQTIGLMAIALVFSFGLVLLGQLGWVDTASLTASIRLIDFDETLLQGMLGALLFAGALHVNLDDLMAQKSVVSILATVGVLTSTLIVGTATWYAAGFLGVDISFLLCLAFGALISPTDPVAVIGILKQVTIPRTLEMKIAGESLFNDGIGVVIFLVLLKSIQSGEDVEALAVAELFLVEAVGGVLLGLILGWVVFQMMKSVDLYHVEILLTLAIVTGGYALAASLHTSGPLAMVVAGIFIGNKGRHYGMSDTTRDRLDDFWELIDEFLNALLFVLIGLEVLIMDWSWTSLMIGLAAIPLVLFSRFTAVGIPLTVLKRVRPISPHAVKVLTWAGLRGGISVALALSLPESEARDLIVTTTYVVVSFSILVQGLSMAPLLRRFYPITEGSLGHGGRAH